MRRLTYAVLSATCLFSSATAASAADLGPRVAKAPAAAPVPLYNWTGLYVGGHVGWGWTDEAATFLSPFGFGTIPPGATFGLNSNGFLAGGQIGFNYQFHPNWVIGVEGDVSWTDHGAAATANGTADFFGVILPVAVGFASDHNWYATATARLGYTWGPGLVYVKGGFAWMNADYTASTTSLGATTSQTIGTTRNGWTVGVGLEYAFAPNWSAKIEYDYLDFGTDSYFFADPGVVGVPFDVDTQVHQVKLGINYRFGWGGPVVARY